MPETLLVTGIHREELGFGDHVAALLDSELIQVMRIPRGISHSRRAHDELFYFNARHREIYLQLHQQVRGRFRLLIDLHCGVNEAGRCADVYCHDQALLDYVSQRTQVKGLAQRLRGVRIVSEQHDESLSADVAAAETHAHTRIPEKVWNDPNCIYVGLEIYLVSEGDGVAQDWCFAADVIELVQSYVREPATVNT
ncbi:MAG: hypothetical protein PVG66_07075 [Chromatiales bacterium]|jgi:hypothetical protein